MAKRKRKTSIAKRRPIMTVYLGESGYSDLVRCQQLLSEQNPKTAAPSLSKAIKISLHALRLKLLEELHSVRSESDPLREEYIRMLDGEIQTDLTEEGK